MKKKFFTLFLLIFLTFTFFNINVYAKENIDENYIYEILKGEAYSYLNDEAKDFIVEVYKETGEVLLTEKNKKDGMIYINPDFIEYLGLSDEEKAKYQIIPDVYLTAQKQTHLDDYTPAFKGGNRFGSMLFSNSLLPSSFDFRNVDGKNYLTPLKNQGNLGLCWAFASVENAETYLMYNKKQSYNPSTTETFSIRQMDYATSSNGLRFAAGSSTYKFNNIYNAFRELGDGGHFFGASLAMMNGITLTDESVVPWNESKYTYHRPEKILNFEQSKYEVDSTINLEALSTSSSLTKRYEMVEKVKNYMIKYGAPSVGTFSPQGSCAFKNKDGKYVLKVDDCYNPSDGHAMQIIGWDDNYSYDYCDYGSYHLSATNGTCSLGTYTTGKGAWIIRNSWGDNTDYKYVYLTYDSTQYDVGFITSLKKMDNRSWDNNYHDMPLTLDGRYSHYYYDSKTFYTRNDKKEKIEKIKFLSEGTNSTFTLNVYSSESNYNITKTLFVEEPGVVTFDLSNDNILVEDSFYVEVTSDTSYSIVIDSLAAFTSNLDNEPSANYYNITNSSAPISETNPLLVNDYTGNKWFVEFMYFPKNFDIDTKPEYRLSKDDKVYNKFGNSIFYYQLDDKGNVDFTTSTLTNYSDGTNTFSMKDAYCKNYNLDVLYNGSVIESLPIKFACEDGTYKYEIKLNANNGNDYSVSNMYLESSIVSLRNISLDKEEMFNDGYYITGWNTKPDGSGTSYDLNASITLSADVELYAMWSSEKLSTNVVYNDNCDNCTGTINNQVVVYGNDIDLMHNAYEKEGSKFLYWSLTSQIPNDLNYYYDFENIKYEDVIKYPIYNNETLNLYAIWSSDYSKVSFDANGGNGSMNEFYVQNSKDSKLLKNTFTKEDHYFVEWNTKADGSGTSYKDGLPINVSEDTILYAQWEKPKFNISVIGGTANVELSVKNETITISADLSLEDERMFDKWIVKTDGVVLSSLTTPTATFTMPEYDVEIEAKYKYYLDVPAPKKDSYEYNGKEQSLLFDNFDSEKLNITNNIGTEIKSYTAVVSIKDKENYIWRDKTNTDKNISWSIVKINVEKPTVENVDFTYNGKEQTLNIKGFDSELMNVSVNKATEIGKYTAIISLKDKEHYNWSDKTTNDISINWNINKILVEKPTVENVEFIYNTKERTLSINGFDSELMNVTGNKATNVGKYIAVISLKDKNHYSWKDKTTNDISIEWNVSKLLVKKPTIETNELVFNSKDLILNIKDLNLDVMNVSGNKAKIVGDYTAIISLKDIDNYAWIDNSVDDISIEWSIVWPENKIAIVDPSLVNDTYYYDGNEITVNVKDLDEDFVTVSGITETNIGEYKAVFSLKDKGHYSWSNGSSDDIEYAWSIVLAKPSLSKSVQYNSIKLSWNSVKDAKYTIYNCDSKGKKCKSIGTTTNTSYVINKLSFNKSYYYKVKVDVKIGENSYTNISNLYGVKTALAAPVLEATTDYYQYTKLSWTKVSGATKYYIYRCNSSGSKCSNVAITSKTSYTYKGGSEGYAYKYKVRAYKSKTYGSYSNLAVGKKVNDAISFSVSNTGYREATITINNTTPSAIAYKIYRSTSKNGKYSLVTTLKGEDAKLKYVNTKLSFNKTYYYKVVASSEFNSSAYSSYKYVTTKGLAKPTITTTLIDDNKAKFETNKVYGATGYEYYYSTDGKNYKLLKRTTSQSYTKTFSYKKYYLKVRSYFYYNKKYYYSSFTSIDPITFIEILKGISINIDSKVPLGEKTKLSVDYTPSHIIEDITYTVSDESIAEIINGEFIGKKEGNVKVSATSESGVTTSKEVYVYIPTTKFQLNKEKTTVYINESETLIVDLLPSNATFKDIKWSSSDSSIATVDSNGVVKGLKEGNIVITAINDEGKKGLCIVFVKEKPLVYSGTGNKTIDLDISKGVYRVDGEFESLSNNYSSLYFLYNTTYNYKNFLFGGYGDYKNGILNYSNSSYENPRLEVKTDGDWTIKVEKITESTSDNEFSGNGSFISGLFEGTGNFIQLDFELKDDYCAYSSVYLYEYGGSYEFLDLNCYNNTFSVTKPFYLKKGKKYFLYINTNRSWKLTKKIIEKNYTTEKQFSGTGNYISKIIKGTGKTEVFNINMGSEGTYDYVYMCNYKSGDCDSLANSSGKKYSGKIAYKLNKNQDYFIYVSSTNDWSVTRESISGTVGNNFAGTGDYVTGLYSGKGYPLAFDISFEANGLNTIYIYEYNSPNDYDYSSLVYTYSAYNGSVSAFLKNGKKYYFVIKSQGNWNVKIKSIPNTIAGSSFKGRGDTVQGFIEGNGYPMIIESNFDYTNIGNNFTNNGNYIYFQKYAKGIEWPDFSFYSSGNHSGRYVVFLAKGKKYFYNVNTQADWNFKIIRSFPTLKNKSISGTGDYVTGVFTATSTSMTFNIKVDKSIYSYNNIELYQYTNNAYGGYGDYHQVVFTDNSVNKKIKVKNLMKGKKYFFVIQTGGGDWSISW